MVDLSTPAWQTEELQDEWVDLDENEEDPDRSYGTQSVSLTAPVSTFIRTHGNNRDLNNELVNNSTVGDGAPVGTFLVREDIPAAPVVLPKTPGRKKKGAIKDFFSPLALERMFEPPSPPPADVHSNAPTIPSRLAQSFIPDSHSSQDQNSSQQSTRSPPNHPALDYKFTFALPLGANLNQDNAGIPQAQSTPGPPYATTGVSNGPPLVDPRLRLFQFQYDTFTRDHLSAMVDSIVVNTPSGGSNASPNSFAFGLSRVSEAAPPSVDLRSTKRLKLSPESDYYGEGDGENAVISRPKVLGKDYVGESLTLIQKIKQARDFSTISTVAPGQSPLSHASKQSNCTTGTEPKPAHSPELLDIPRGQDSDEPSRASSSKGGAYSSYAYRQQAADLMAQIKNDMKGSKRIFSADTDVSSATRTDYKSFVQSSFDDNDKNDTQISRTSAKSTAKSKMKQKSTPRKSSRKANSNEEIEGELTERISSLALKEHWSRLSALSPVHPSTSASSSAPQPPKSPGHAQLAALNTNSQHLVPPGGPAYPSSSLRNDDLNRFVSSSTASGTTLTAGSAPSFVKHAGPIQMRRIGPEDVEGLPDRVGKMVFDKVMLKWVKATAEAMDESTRGAVMGTDGESEDPFRDIESLREEETGRGRSEMEDDVTERREHEERRMSRIDEASVETREEYVEQDAEETELTSFSFDASNGAEVVMVDLEAEENETTDSDDVVDQTETQDQQFEDDGFVTEDNGQPSVYASPRQPRHRRSGAFTSPRRVSLVPGTPPVRSALKSASGTPVSALKDPGRQRYRTPAQRHRHRRSVSFSDGKRDGPIRGLGRGDDSANVSIGVVPSKDASMVQSTRSKRIAEMMGGLEDTDSEGNQSPNNVRRLRSDDSEPEQLRPSYEQANFTQGSSKTRREPSKADAQQSQSRNKANGTFLTECSFGVAHDRLVEVITDVQPFEPHWEELSAIELVSMDIESVARLKEFLPKLDSLNLNSNKLSWLSGIPETVRTLSVASNLLTGITSFGHLLNLENLDISRNDVESLSQLECLRHLRELRADGNKITSIDGLRRMDGLVKVSLRGNLVRNIDFSEYRWTRLEMLNVSQNHLGSISGVGSLPSLIALNLDDNALGALEAESAMPRLRILRVSNNRLQQLDVSHFPGLRTLYADNNSLKGLLKVDRLTKLENLSLRNQSGRGFNLLTRETRDVKRLYLSGNPLKEEFFEEPCYNLVYLELAACRLTSLPDNLARILPNLRVLNLNYNFLEDTKSLEGLARLKKLTIIGSRLKGTKPIIRLLQGMPDVEMLDFRMNPCTLGWYLPLLVKDVPGASQPPEGLETKPTATRKSEKSLDVHWRELDSKFRRDLPDEVYVGRLAYRGLVMRACPRIRTLDGIEVSEKERMKAQRLLQSILAKSKQRGTVSGVVTVG